MDPVWTLRRDISFLLSDLLSSNVSSSGKSFGSRSDITHHTWSRVTKKSYFRLIFLCMPPSLACEHSRFSLLLTRTLRHVPSGEEQGETAVFAGYNFQGLPIPFWQPLERFQRKPRHPCNKSRNYASVLREFGCSRRIVETFSQKITRFLALKTLFDILEYRFLTRK